MEVDQPEASSSTWTPPVRHHLAAFVVDSRLSRERYTELVEADGVVHKLVQRLMERSGGEAAQAAYTLQYSLQSTLPPHVQDFQRPSAFLTSLPAVASRFVPTGAARPEPDPWMPADEPDCLLGALGTSVEVLSYPAESGHVPDSVRALAPPSAEPLLAHLYPSETRAHRYVVLITDKAALSHNVSPYPDDNEYAPRSPRWDDLDWGNAGERLRDEGIVCSAVVLGPADGTSSSPATRLEKLRAVCTIDPGETPWFSLPANSETYLPSPAFASTSPTVANASTVGTDSIVTPQAVAMYDGPIDSIKVDENKANMSAQMARMRATAGDGNLAAIAAIAQGRLDPSMLTAAQQAALSQMQAQAQAQGLSTAQMFAQLQAKSMANTQAAAAAAAAASAPLQQPMPVAPSAQLAAQQQAQQKIDQAVASMAQAIQQTTDETKRQTLINHFKALVGRGATATPEMIRAINGQQQLRDVMKAAGNIGGAGMPQLQRQPSAQSNQQQQTQQQQQQLLATIAAQRHAQQSQQGGSAPMANAQGQQARMAPPQQPSNGAPTRGPASPIWSGQLVLGNKNAPLASFSVEMEATPMNSAVEQFSVDQWPAVLESTGTMQAISIAELSAFAKETGSPVCLLQASSASGDLSNRRRYDHLASTLGIKGLSSAFYFGPPGCGMLVIANSYNNNAGVKIWRLLGLVCLRKPIPVADNQSQQPVPVQLQPVPVNGAPPAPVGLPSQLQGPGNQPAHAARNAQASAQPAPPPPAPSRPPLTQQQLAQLQQQRQQQQAFAQAGQGQASQPPLTIASLQQQQQQRQQPESAQSMPGYNQQAQPPHATPNTGGPIGGLTQQQFDHIRKLYQTARMEFPAHVTPTTMTSDILQKAMQLQKQLHTAQLQHSQAQAAAKQTQAQQAQQAQQTHQAQAQAAVAALGAVGGLGGGQQGVGQAQGQGQGSYSGQLGLQQLQQLASAQFGYGGQNAQGLMGSQYPQQ